MTEVFAIVLVVIGTFFGSYGSLFLKKGSANISLNIIEQIQNYKLILGVFLYGLATLVFVPALKFGELSVLYPITSLTYVWISFLSIKYLDEKMNVYKWAGITLILLGVILVTR